MRGFTVLEMIVVLMITGLITVILFQGLGLALQSRLRVSDQLTDLDQRALQVSILSTPLKALIPDYPDGSDVFQGQAQRLRGLTMMPLQGTAGAPTGFGMAIDYDPESDETILTYFERGYDAVAIARWPGDKGAFSYRGREGDWATSWPPRDDPQAVQAPRTVRLSTGLYDDLELVLRVMGPHERVGRFQDSPFAQ